MRAWLARWTAWTAAVLAGLTVGCSGGGSAPAPGVPSNPAAKTVYQFLDAVRQNKPEAGQYLSPLALKLTQELDFVFAPPASSTAAFEIGDVISDEDPTQVGVLTYWRDVDADGKPFEEEILWGVKQVDGQWRICAMMYQPDPAVEKLV